MVWRCCVCCKYEDENKNISFHSFPKDIYKKTQWLKAIGKTEIAKSARLCSDHFNDSDYKESVFEDIKKRLLKNNAVPLIDLRNATVKAVINDKVSNDCQVEDSNNICPETVRETIRDITNLKRKCLTSDPWKEEFQDEDFLRYRSVTDINWKNISHCPKKSKMCWDIACEIIQEQKQELQKLKATIILLNAKIQSMNDLIQHLRSKDF